MHHLFLADAGVPMICVQWPFMFCALVPVIVIEALIVRRRLHLSNRRSFIAATKANLFSTLAGVPLAWILMLIAQFTMTWPLVSTVEKRHWLTGSPLTCVYAVANVAWTGPSPFFVGVAATVLLIPTFFISVYLERRSYRKSWPDVDSAAVNRSVWVANLASYCFLLAVLYIWVRWQFHFTYPKMGFI